MLVPGSQLKFLCCPIANNSNPCMKIPTKTIPIYHYTPSITSTPLPPYPIEPTTYNTLSIHLVPGMRASDSWGLPGTVESERVDPVGRGRATPTQQYKVHMIRQGKPSCVRPESASAPAGGTTPPTIQPPTSHRHHHTIPSPSRSR